MATPARNASAAAFTSHAARGPTAAGVRRAHGVIAAVTIGLIGVVLAGFWPYFSNIGGGPERPWIIHLHGAVFGGWMLLLLAQVILVWRRRTALHRRIGRTIGIALGVLVFVMGIFATVVAPVAHVARGEWRLDEAAAFLVLPIGDMLLFAPLFAAGIAYRRRAELHKRYMLLATIALAFAPAARVMDTAPLPVLLAFWLLPLMLLMAGDLWIRRRVHSVYVLGAVVFVVAFARVALMESPAWLRIGRAMVTALGPIVAPLL